MSEVQMFPSIRFNDQKCREAMEFYKDCFGGELQFMTVKDGPMAAEVPEESHGLIMHSTLRNNGWTLVGSDMMRDRATAGDQVGIMVDFKNESEMRA
ncbi:MAG TPA: VOC family protein, partial [Candidatus Paceibacterota bacterium]